MPRKPPAAAMAGSPDDIEARFYEALQRGDLDSLMALWADDDEVVCVHPGGGVRLVGAAAIRASFEAIFAGNGGVPVRPQQVHRLQQLGFAVHHLVEKIEADTPQGRQVAWVLATNVFVKTTQGWRLAAHHASPAEPQEPAPVRGEPPTTLH
jgi:uncharacterized protein (TIGR02246 family)